MKKSLVILFSLGLLTAITTPLMAAGNLIVTPVTLFPLTLAVGNQATAEYKVTNPGNVTLYHIQVSKKPSFVTVTTPVTGTQCQPDGSLASGASCYIGLAINSISAGSTAIPSDNMPAVSANDGTYISYPSLAEQRFNVTAVTSTTVSATVSQDLPANISDGSVHLATIEFANDSQQALTNVQAELESTAGFALDSTTCTGTLAAGGSCQVQATYTVPLSSSGPIALSVTLSSNQSDTAIAQMSSTITDVTMTGTSVPLPAYINQGVTYSMGYSFTNSTDTAQSSSTATKITTALTAPSGAVMSNQCDAMSSLAAATSCMITGHYTIPDAQTAEVNFEATLAYQQGANVHLAHSSQVITNAGVKCWGRNVEGELGDDNNENRLTPVAVKDLGSGVVAITGGGLHTCALLQTGAVK
jgi:hypothetical protein